MCTPPHAGFWRPYLTWGILYRTPINCDTNTHELYHGASGEALARAPCAAETWPTGFASETAALPVTTVA